MSVYGSLLAWPLSEWESRQEPYYYLKTLVSVRCGVLVSLERLCYNSWGLQYTFQTLFPKLLKYRSGLRVSKTFIMALNKRMEVGTCLS